MRPPSKPAAERPAAELRLELRPVVSAGEMAQQSHPHVMQPAPMVMEVQPVEVAPLTQPNLTPPNAEVVPAPLQQP